jgi:hypothetical protein
MRRAAKIDDNQTEIVKNLRKAGYSVCILSAVGKGVPDILVGANGVNILMEIKDGNKPLSARKLTPDEAKWHQSWKGQVAVVSSLYEALTAVFVHSVKQGMINE